MSAMRRPPAPSPPKLAAKCTASTPPISRPAARQVARIEAEVGPIEILVNNAGITRDATMKRMTREMWDAVIDTNLGSCFNLCKLVWEGCSPAASAASSTSARSTAKPANTGR